MRNVSSDLVESFYKFYKNKRRINNLDLAEMFFCAKDLTIRKEHYLT